MSFPYEVIISEVWRPPACVPDRSGHRPLLTRGGTASVSPTKCLAEEEDGGKASGLGTSSPELFGVKHQFHIVDDRRQVFQRRPLQNEIKADCWGWGSLAKIHVIYNYYEEPRIPRRERSHPRWESDDQTWWKTRKLKNKKTYDPQTVVTRYNLNTE